MNDELVLYTTRKRIIFCLLFTLPFLALSLWGWVTSGDPFLLCAALFWGFCTTCLVLGARSVPVDQAGLVVDTQGITYYEWPWGFVPWEDIEELGDFCRDRYNHWEIYVQVRNPDKYYSQLSFLDRVMLAPRRFLGPGHFAISFFCLDGTRWETGNYILRLKSFGKIPMTFSIKGLSGF